MHNSRNYIGMVAPKPRTCMQNMCGDYWIMLRVDHKIFLVNPTNIAASCKKVLKY